MPRAELDELNLDHWEHMRDRLRRARKLVGSVDALDARFLVMDPPGFG